MNASSFAEFRAGSLAAPQDDEKMEQVRELLFGDYQRQSEARLAMLEARIRELELTVHHGLEAMHERVEQLAGQTSADHRAAFEELSRGIADLGGRIGRSIR